MGRAISPAPGTFKNVQRGTIDLNAVSSNTANVSPVDTTKAQLRILGFSADNNSFILAPRVSLTNSTTVTANRATSTGQTIVSWELTEVF